MLDEGRKRDAAANAVLALSFAANATQSPQSLVSSGKVEAPGVANMQRLMDPRKKRKDLDLQRVSHSARNKLRTETYDDDMFRQHSKERPIDDQGYTPKSRTSSFLKKMKDLNLSSEPTKKKKKKTFKEFVEEAYITEGKVEWDNPKRPLQSGLTPREKNRAVRKRLGIENPDTDSFFKGGPSERDYERYGKLKAAHDTEKDKEVPDEKRHKFKSVAKGRLGGEHSAGRIRRVAGVHKGAEIGKNAEKRKGRYAVMSQTQGGEEIRQKHKKRYGDYADLKRLKEPKESKK